jgi:hypothetical protein
MMGQSGVAWGVFGWSLSSGRLSSGSTIQGVAVQYKQWEYSTCRGNTVQAVAVQYEQWESAHWSLSNKQSERAHCQRHLWESCMQPGVRNLLAGNLGRDKRL